MATTVKVFCNSDPSGTTVIEDVEEVNNDDGVFVINTEKKTYFFPYTTVHHIEAIDL